MYINLVRSFIIFSISSDLIYICFLDKNGYNNIIYVTICWRYLIMKGQMDTQLGQILIDADVISTYAGSVAVECFGIVGMAAVNMKDGLVKLLKKDYLNHGINVTIDADNEINIDFHVIVSYGVSISTVSDNLIETVKYKVESFTGLKIKTINIYVEGVRVID